MFKKLWDGTKVERIRAEFSDLSRRWLQYSESQKRKFSETFMQSQLQFAERHPDLGNVSKKFLANVASEYRAQARRLFDTDVAGGSAIAALGMVLELKAIASQDAEELCRWVVAEITKFVEHGAPPSSDIEPPVHSTSPQQSAKVNSDSGDMDLCIRAAEFVRKRLIAFEVYKKAPGRLLTPQALGYFSGWCDMAVRAAGFNMQSYGTMAVICGMFTTIYDKEHLNLSGADYEPGIEAFKASQKRLTERNEDTVECAKLGASDFNNWLKDGKMPSGLFDLFF